MWITADGNIYAGDCQHGDREATASEVAAFMTRNRQIPGEVTRFQARAALHQYGLLDDIESMIAAQETDMMLRLAWQDALTFKRASPMVLNMAQSLGLSEQQLDDLFIAAAQIE